MQHIHIRDLSVEFRRYHNIEPSLKRKLIDSLRRRRRRPDVLAALSGINLDVGVGERVGIVGMNGAGKSTLLKSIVGIYPPTRGEIEVCGRVMPLLELGAGFEANRTARENIYLNGSILGLTRKQVRSREGAIIEFSGLAPFMDNPLKSLSSGMRARLGFSIATSLEPEILVLDEVFAAGDKAFVKKAKARMRALVDECKILLFVSHSEELVRELCTRVVVLHHGRLVMDGATDDAFAVYNSLVAESEN